MREFTILTVLFFGHLEVDTFLLLLSRKISKFYYTLCYFKDKTVEMPFEVCFRKKIYEFLSYTKQSKLYRSNMDSFTKKSIYRSTIMDHH